VTKITEQDLETMSEVLGVTKEELSNMTEEDLRQEIDKAEQQFRVLEQNIAMKDKQLQALRSENIKLRFDGVKLKLACFIHQIQIGFLQAIYDIKYCSIFDNSIARSLLFLRLQ